MGLRSVDALVELASRGNLRAMGRLLTILENPGLESVRLLERVMERARGAHVVGFTGIPGSGKSTLVSRVVGKFRERGYRVAVIAVDPSSPLTQGSLLGDRLRMQEHATDPGVFIRSIPTRGIKGGISLAAIAMAEAFDAFGYDKIIIETVGVGQAEVDVMHAAHTIVVVTMPGAGDDIQALKAGVMEIGDVYVVNKSDKPEASKTYEYLKFALEKGEIGEARGQWEPRIVKTSAVMGMGIEDLVKALEDHYSYLKTTGMLEERIRSRRSLLLRLYVEAIISETVGEVVRASGTGSKSPSTSLSESIRSTLEEVIRQLSERYGGS